MSYVTKKSKVNMKAAIISLFTLLSISCCYGDQVEEANIQLSHFIADLWLEGADVLKVLWRDCSKKLIDVKDVIDQREYFPKFLRCMKRKTLRALDRSLSTDVVPIFDGINLVRFELVDRSGNIMPDNHTSTWTENELEKEEWRALAIKRIAKVLRTHVIKFELDDKKAAEKGTTEFRGKRRHHMMTMMLFGIVSIGMVLVPTGFQFLAVLGGKALVLAKMALILASIQGLKKITSNPVNYGYYHYPPYEQIERRSDDDWFLPEVIQENLLPTKTARANLNPGTIKTDKLDKIERKNTILETKKMANIMTWNPELPKAVKIESEPRVYPVYYDSSASSAAIDSPNLLLDLTTKPGEVQADYSLDFPYNGFRFQSPTVVVSA